MPSPLDEVHREGAGQRGGQRQVVLRGAQGAAEHNEVRPGAYRLITDRCAVSGGDSDLVCWRGLHAPIHSVLSRSARSNVASSRAVCSAYSAYGTPLCATSAASRSSRPCWADATRCFPLLVRLNCRRCPPAGSG